MNNLGRSGQINLIEMEYDPMVNAFRLEINHIMTVEDDWEHLENGVSSSLSIYLCNEDSTAIYLSTSTGGLWELDDIIRGEFHQSSDV